MKTLATVKKDLEFNRGLSSLIEVLKNIAVSQYRALEKRMRTFDVFLETLEEFFGLIDFSAVTHPFSFSQDLPQAVLAVTSDSGLLGGLNMQIVSAAVAELEKKPGQLIVVGERGKMYARENKMPVVSFGGINDEQRSAQARQMADFLLERARAGKCGDIRVVYAHPVSFTLQKVQTVVILPFQAPASSGTKAGAATGDVMLESRLDDVVEYVVSQWVVQKLYEIFGFSRLSEFAARYVHLEESLQKLKEMDGKLRLEYFRIRHELIDRNMRELFSARLLYAS